MTWTNRVRHVLWSHLHAVAAHQGSAASASTSWRAGPDCLSTPVAPALSFAPGDQVRVCHGVFCGVEGTVIERRGDSRLVIAVDVVEQGVSMEIDADMVGPLDYGRR